MDLPQEIVLFFEQDPNLIEDAKKAHRSLYGSLDRLPHSVGLDLDGFAQAHAGGRRLQFHLKGGFVAFVGADHLLRVDCAQ